MTRVISRIVLTSARRTRSISSAELTSTLAITKDGRREPPGNSDLSAAGGGAPSLQRAPVTTKEKQGKRKGAESARGQVVDGDTPQATPTQQMARQVADGVLEPWQTPKRAQRCHHKPRGYSRWGLSR